MPGMELNVDMRASGRQGPPRSQEEADADQARGLAAIDLKRQRLNQLQERFEAEGHPPARARVLAVQAYHTE